MKEKIKKVIKSTVFTIVLVISLTGLVLWLTLRNDFDKVMEMLRNANIWMLLFIVGLMVFDRIIHGWGLKKECNVSCPDYKWSQGFVNSYTGSLFNNITPSASGGQFAQVYIFTRQGVPVSNAIGVLWLDFIIYQTTMSIFVLLLLILRFGYYFSHYSQFLIIVLFGFVVNTAVILALWAMVRFPRFYHWLSTSGVNIGAKLHLIKDKEKTKKSIEDQLARFEKEVVVLKNNKKMIFKIALSNLLRLTIYYSVPFFCAIALHIPIGFDKMLDVLALSSFVAMVNAFVPLPGSSGGTEASFILMFSTLFNRIDVSSIMILWRVMTYYFQTLLGGVVFLYGKTRPIVIHDNIQLMPAGENTVNSSGDDGKIDNGGLS